MQEKKHSIEISSVFKEFANKESSSIILHSLSYTFNQGISYAIMGNSGIGKSTLLHIIAGFESADRGTVLYHEDHSSTVGAKTDMLLQKNIGFVFQSPHLIDELSVIENVMIKGLIFKDPYESALERAHDALAAVGLSSKANDAPHILSGGERRRVAVARALFTKPAFIIADEPTAHLDERNAERMMDLLLACQQSYEAGIIIASHDTSIAQRCDRLLLLEKGALSEVGPHGKIEPYIERFL